MRRINTILVTSLVLGLLTTTNSAAAVKAGGSCSKLGSITTSNGSKYTCIKSGKKLIWKAKVSKGSKVGPVNTNDTVPRTEVDIEKYIYDFKDRFRNLTPFVVKDNIDDTIPNLVIGIPKFDPTTYFKIQEDKVSYISIALISDDAFFCSLKGGWIDPSNIRWENDDADQNFKINSDSWNDFKPAYYYQLIWHKGSEPYIAALNKNNWQLNCLTDWSKSKVFGLELKVGYFDKSKSSRFAKSLSYVPEKIINSPVKAGERCAPRDKVITASDGSMYICSDKFEANGFYPPNDSKNYFTAQFGKSEIFSGFFNEFRWRKLLLQN